MGPIIDRIARLWIIVSLCVTAVVHAEPPVAERIEWNKVPVEIVLKTDTETQVQFPAPVKVGVPAGLKAELRTQSVGDTVYFQASAAFETTRIVVQTRDGAHTYLLDLAASATADLRPLLRIVDAAMQDKPDETSDVDADLASTRQSDPVALTRYAAQQLYAPSRLLNDVPAIVRVPVRTERVDLFRGGSVTAVPLIAWRSGVLHVTAVKLTNTGSAPIELDPRALRGAWLTATFQHNRLLAAGDEADTTVVYLVSARPFAAAR